MGKHLLLRLNLHMGRYVVMIQTETKHERNFKAGSFAKLLRVTDC